MFSFKKKLDNQSIFSGNIPSVGEKEDPIDKEQAAEEERLRQEAIKEAEEKRRVKHKKMEEDRENMRQGIRDRVRCFHNFAEKREHALQGDAFVLGQGFLLIFQISGALGAKLFFYEMKPIYHTTIFKNNF